MTPTPTELLAQAEAVRPLAEGTTPGPWTYNGRRDIHVTAMSGIHSYRVLQNLGAAQDGALAAAAPTLHALTQALAAALAESLERERGLRGALSDIRVEAWGRRLPTKRLADLIARPSVVATAHPLEEK